MADRVPTPLLVVGIVLALWTVANVTGVMDGPTSAGFDSPFRSVLKYF